MFDQRHVDVLSRGGVSVNLEVGLDDDEVLVLYLLLRHGSLVDEVVAADWSAVEDPSQEVCCVYSGKVLFDGNH